MFPPDDGDMDIPDLLSSLLELQAGAPEDQSPLRGGGRNAWSHNR